MPKWLELSLDFACNNRCLGCFSNRADGPRMTTREAVANLALGRQYDVRSLWIGGGEATLRPDLPTIVGAARKLGYDRVKLQTNGNRLADPAYTRRLVEVGLTEVNFSIKGASEGVHDGWARTPGSHRLMLAGMRVVRGLGLPAFGDVLVYRRTVEALPDIVRTYQAEGLQGFNVWLFSTADQGAQDLRPHVPRLSEVAPQIVEASRYEPPGAADFLVSLHTPACCLPPGHRHRAFHAAALEMLVANPGARRFLLERSPMEGGAWLESCKVCAFHERCSGPRADYVALYGVDEFVPIDPAEGVTGEP